MTEPAPVSPTDASNAYHPVTSPDFALTERIRIHIEDGLFDTAIANIESILFSGLSSQPPTPGLLVPPTYIRFFTTLLCHPFYTTQVRTKSLPVTGPEAAHILLRRIISIIGPISSNLEAAWAFSSPTEARAGRRKQGIQGGGGRSMRATASPEGDGDDHISGALANEESLFNVAEDFWAVVGWALNCSVKHKARWRHWRNVLDVMLLGLEKDWEDRLRRYIDANNRRRVTAERDDDGTVTTETTKPGEKKKLGTGNSKVVREDTEAGPEVHLNNALIMTLLPSTYGSAGYKRVIRSIFADGSERSMAEFTELWPDELVRRRKKINGRQEIGKTMSRDQYEESSDEEDERLDGDKDKEDVEMMDGNRPVNAVDRWGGLDAVDFRQRLLTLLYTVCYYGKFISIEDLMMQLQDNIRHLPLLSFQLFTSGFIPAPPAYRSCLAQTILDSIRTPQSASKMLKDDEALSLELFMHLYAPYPANTVNAAENAKIAILIEVLARLLSHVGDFAWSQELEEVIETGIKVRRKKGTRLRPGESKEEVMSLWDAADRKLRMWVRMAKDNVAKDDRKG